MSDKFNKAKTKQLFVAVEKNNAKGVAKLVEAGADPNAQSKEYMLGFTGPRGATPLTLAAAVSRPPVLDALVKAGADANLPAKGPGVTPLMACGFNVGNVKKLIALGADPDMTAGSRKETALHHALRWSMEAVCKTLIDLGADPSVKNKAGKSATELALEEGYDELHALMVKSSRKGKAGSSDGRAPAGESDGDRQEEFLNALIDGTAAKVKKLITSGCDPHRPISDVAPLAISVRQGNYAAAKSLLEHGARAAEVTIDDCDLDPKLLALLLDHGADPNANHASISMLMHAIHNGAIEAVKLLVEAGAKTRTKDARHEIAVAEMSGHQQIAGYLSERFVAPEKLKPSKTLAKAAESVASCTGIAPEASRSLPVHYRCPLKPADVLSRQQMARYPGRTKAAQQGRQELAARQIVEQLVGTLPKCDLYCNGGLVLIEKKDRWHQISMLSAHVKWLKSLEKLHPFHIISFASGLLECRFTKPIPRADIRSSKQDFPKSADGPQLQSMSSDSFTIDFDA